MRERALLAGGRLNVASEDGGPTSVTAVLPVPA
jgi:signal transduction histidine kinase